MALVHPAPVLFATMFASQASFIVLTAVLPDLARDFGVSTATAGQTRTIAAVAGGVTALALGRLGRRLAVRELLLRPAPLLTQLAYHAAETGADADHATGPRQRLHRGPGPARCGCPAARCG